MSGVADPVKLVFAVLATLRSPNDPFKSCSHIVGLSRRRGHQAEVLGLDEVRDDSG